MNRRLIVLVLALIIASMAVIEVRHRSRVMYAELQALQTERDRLNIEWGRLLLEEGAWSQHRRVEVAARRELNMHLPSAEEVVVIRAPAEADR